MKRGYAISLALIVLLLTVSLSVSASYGLWRITKEDSNISVAESGCFEVIYINNEILSIQDFTPLNIENGRTTTPYSFAIENKCNTEKTAEIRLNILDNNTLETRGLTVYLTGDVELSPTKYSDLKNSHSVAPNLMHSKVLNTVTIPAKSTKRSNLKLWIDEKVVSSVDQNQIFKGMFEITDKESIVLPTFKETLLENNGGLETINTKSILDFNQIAVNEDGLFPIVDQDGTSYYFRGKSENNYVAFANKIWRIVRINGDETVRLILQDNIGDIEFNQNRNSQEYAGYTYPKNEENQDSLIKTMIDDWYKTNITDQDFDKYVAMSKYCNDTNSYEEGYHFFFNATKRIVNNKTPSLICEVDQETNFGGSYKLKVGLITADEAMLSGLNLKVPNPYGYLNNGTEFYTMTPSDYYIYSTYNMIVKQDGSLADTQVSNKKGVRPVLSLKSTLVVEGDGTINNPYRIEQDAQS